MTKDIEAAFKFRLNKNQAKDLCGLIVEIQRRDKISLVKIIKYLESAAQSQKHSGKEKFFYLKKVLIKLRFPLSSKSLNIEPKNIFISPLIPSSVEPAKNNYSFIPENIFVENSVKGCWLEKNFRAKFPQVPIKYIDHHGLYLKYNKFTINDLKKPIVFIVKESWDFIKPCPCTKEHISCGYWVLNLGFGCPFDCSYCFLQQYSNFPGIILPANLEDFFAKFDRINESLKSPIRIGTGEFCDSLALDHITEYSSKLINYFRSKKVLFELKTKSVNIENLLKTDPGKNIVISWSLNPQKIIKTEELGTADLEERLLAAEKLQNKGYKIAFHFDPIIHDSNWQNLYQESIEKIYQKLKTPLAWISIGTLRCNRGLKPISQARFPNSGIFYGELLLGQDKKLRYPEFLRKNIYQFIIKTIRSYDEKTPIYLCMENKLMWQELLSASSTQEIEKNLLFNV